MMDLGNFKEMLFCQLGRSRGAAQVPFVECRCKENIGAQVPFVEHREEGKAGSFTKVIRE